MHQCSLLYYLRRRAAYSSTRRRALGARAFFSICAFCVCVFRVFYPRVSCLLFLTTLPRALSIPPLRVRVPRALRCPPLCAAPAVLLLPACSRDCANMIGSRSGYMPISFARLVPAPGICPSPLHDWFPLRVYAPLPHVIGSLSARERARVCVLVISSRAR
eukprot:1187964-Prorocentrum_minimum.AAC.2